MKKSLENSKIISSKNFLNEKNILNKNKKINLIINSFYPSSFLNKKINLKKLDCIFFRKDPPVNEEYIGILQIFRELEYQNTLVINSPETLLKHNEKVLGFELSEQKIPTIVTSSTKRINSFLNIHRDIVFKPMNMMAGQGIIKLKALTNNKK